MQDFIHFVGRFHVLALHLPIGIMVVAVILDWVARGERYRALARVAPFLWTATAISAVLTAVLGYLHFSEGGFTGYSATRASVLRDDARGLQRARLVALFAARASSIDASTWRPASSRSRS